MIRTISSALLLAAASVAALASPVPGPEPQPGFDISGQLMASEAKVRAGLTPEVRSRAQSLEARLSSRLTLAQVEALE